MGFDRYSKMARIWSVAAVSICLMISLAGCREEKAKVAPKPPVVTVMEVVPRDVPVSIEYVAQTQSSHQVDIHARVSGFLDRRMYREGELVKQGQVLFQMDSKPFQAQLNQALAVLSMQNATLQTARANLARIKPLAELKALSQKDLDDATGQFESASAAVEQAKAQVETARLNLSYTTITSPVTGVAGAAQQTDGTYISTQNSLLTTVAVLSPMWVNFSISENEMQRFRNQADKGLIQRPKDDSYLVEVLLVDGSVFSHTGRIAFADPSFNSQTGTFLIRASVENPQGILRPNQYVRVRLRGATRPNAILVPQAAVQQGPKGHFVWVVGADGKVDQRPVVVGDWHGKDWFIFEGLAAGDRVVVEGTLALRPDLPVVVKPYSAAEASSAVETKPKTDADKAGK
ncbi:efflux RND transporter periplasmic adaptor subunit [Desulfatirhabdium butyrativorans]|uniref:efflux RND transporter periplasmic adaptor subunit n=1 Tax=Desulfatirhabdium butyrativorans TaxID=340467 RepID=UPI0003FDE556|nr:efflux RND transporter periplasmic adaptor subunit [Desulfatirhabdium butyrativorans]